MKKHTYQKLIASPYTILATVVSTVGAKVFSKGDTDQPLLGNGLEEYVSFDVKDAWAKSGCGGCGGCGGGGDSSGGGGGDSSGGGGKGGGGGSDPTSSGYGGSDPTSNSGPAAFGGGEGGPAGNAGASTPFLYVWDGEKYILENDVMFGYPSTLRPDEKTGKHLYESKKIGGDQYVIRGDVRQEGGRIHMQIREIEPEESFIDGIALKCTTIRDDQELFVNDKMSRTYAFSRSEVENAKGVQRLRIATGTGKEIQGLLSNVTDALSGSLVEGTHLMQVGEFIEITAKVSDRTQPLNFLLYSQYRDWTAGVIDGLDSEQTLGEIIQKKWQKAVYEFANEKMLLKKVQRLTTATLGILFLTVYFPFHVNTVRNEQSIDVASDFSVPQASADYSSGGRSLSIEYFKDGAFIQTGLVQPRYAHATPHVVSIPAEAIDREGNVRIRVTATKRHEIVAATLFVSEQEEISYTSLMPERAVLERTQEDYAPILRTRHTGEYLRLRPTDIVDLVFNTGDVVLGKKDGTKLLYMLDIAGFYIPLTKKTRMQMDANWVENLRDEDKEFLKSLYALQNYPTYA